MTKWNCSSCVHQSLCYAFKKFRDIASIGVFDEHDFPEIVGFLSSKCEEYEKRGDEK